MLWWRPAADPHRTPGWLTARPYAHRGLHGGGIVENSRAAFEAAIAKDFGIELDVRSARCGTPFVFHDASLTRLCGIDERLGDLDRTDVSSARLKGEGGTIPTLDEIFDLVAGRVPVLVEVKSERALDSRFCGQLLDVLTGYQGPAALMSFDPRLMQWFAGHAPELLRGLVISEEGKSRFKGLIEKGLAVRIARPDFLAYDIRSLPASFAGRWRRSGRPLLSWTVRSAADASIARQHADQIIHEWDGAA